MDPEYEIRLHGSPVHSPLKKLRMKSPLTSPQKEVYSDRYLPMRNPASSAINGGFLVPRIDYKKFKRPTRSTEVLVTGNNVDTGNAQANNAGTTTAPGTINTATAVTATATQATATSPTSSNSGAYSNFRYNDENDIYSSLIRNEVLPLSINEQVDPIYLSNSSSNFVNKESSSLFSFKVKHESPLRVQSSPYSMSPISFKSQQLLKSPRKPLRRVPRHPYKVLDAPELQDDFYLNLVDWSSTNVLAVGLGSCVYLWNAASGQVTRLCDLQADNDNITSVSWSERGQHVAVGTHRGHVQIWDVQCTKRTHSYEGHNARVGALAWNSATIVSGSRDRTIRLRDTRCISSNASGNGESENAANPSAMATQRLIREHRQEVCGLRWSLDKQMLASGGNDNRLLIWSSGNLREPTLQYDQHLAAVKAISWSPHQHGLLASGGGTADKTIRFWNTLNGQPLKTIDTGSQVCNIAWSKYANELITTHGYSQNQILLWNYPSMEKFATLTGHTFRVLYLALSPEGENIVTGAGDETLRFWNVFRKNRSNKIIPSKNNLFDLNIR